VWRIALSEHISDPLQTILTQWTLDDMMDAHDALDYLDALAEESYGAEADRR